MNHKLFTTLSGLTISGVLLVTGLTSAGPTQRTPEGGERPAVAAIEGLEANAVEAVEEVAPATRRHHRGRASLSMPYFSFAQSLRPRG
ncbi:MAG: hypothetical protein EOP92_40640 [Lysobacteraceae bacterium]|jgi:hypothetical protein|nr:MAG: hypothetical protein EOP92_40640 [Xanthomonadaceae bacterium]